MGRQHLKLTFGLALLMFIITWSTIPKTFAQVDSSQQSMLVMGESAELVQAAVESVGATITHDLSVIDAVAADLTEAQAMQLTADDRVQRLHTNDTAHVTGVRHLLRDNFSKVAHDNNDGTSDFKSNWHEGKDDDDPGSGNIVIWWGAAYLKGDNVRFRRTANLENAVEVTLSFDYDRFGFDDNDDDYVIIEVHYNDEWYEVDRLVGRDQSWGMEHASYDISQYASDATRIRFRNSKELSQDETFKLDNFQVLYSVDDGSGTEMVIVRDQFDEQTFNANAGTGAWSGEWAEGNDYGWALFGDVLVWDGNLIVKGSEKSVRRLVDLSDAATATLRLSARGEVLNHGWGGNDDDDTSYDPSEVFVKVEVSTDYGSTWTELDRLSCADPCDSADFQAYEYDLAPYIGNEVTLRLRTSEQTTTRNMMSIDFVEVEFTTQQIEEAEIDLFDFPVATLIEADKLHDEGITGEGVTVAVIDTGFHAAPALNLNKNGGLRVLAQYNAISDTGVLLENILDLVSNDDSGHGAHITSVIANSDANDNGKYLGVAPDVDLMLVKAFSADGAASYADVIRAIDKVIEYKDALNIRVLNLSFYSTPQSHYWEDPVGQAVMRAWEAGIVVVTGAGNTGPDPLSIGVPGNVPYVITVGAITDNYTPLDSSDDYIPAFSSAGPTYDGFLKPEVVAPGAHVLGLVGAESTLAQSYPQFAKANNFYSLSGTSMSAAVTSGVVALMLEADPSLTPDDVKCRLIDSAHTAVDDDGNLAFSVFQQGAGVVNAFDAVNSTMTGCANGGLDVSADLDDTAHFVGAVEVNENGEFFVRDEFGGENLNWDGEYAGTGVNYLWSGVNYLWSGANYMWSGANYMWSGANYLWSGANYMWSGANYMWSGAEFDPAVSTVSVSIILGE